MHVQILGFWLVNKKQTIPYYENLRFQYWLALKMRSTRLVDSENLVIRRKESLLNRTNWDRPALVSLLLRYRCCITVSAFTFIIILKTLGKVLRWAASKNRKLLHYNGKSLSLSFNFAKQTFVKFHLQRPNSSKMSRLGKFFLSYQIN